VTVTPARSDDLARDVLGELVSIGCGNALTSLHRLLGGGPISMAPPRWVSCAADIDRIDLPGVAVWVSIQGDPRCTILTLFDDRSAYRLAGTLLSRSRPVTALGPLEESAVLETVNIISCAFLGALGTMIHGVLIPSPPAMEYGRLVEILPPHLGSENSVVVATGFHDARVGYAGHIVLVAEEGAAQVMLRAVGVAA
jgi:chemotaxis protein CheY-P-specific phosphatase CheC